MNVSRISLTSIPEHQSEINSESQNASIEGFWHNSDISQSIHAARIERTLREMPIAPRQHIQPVQQQPAPIIRTAKNFFYKASMVCGVLALPSFAFVAFGVVGLVVPAALFLACVVFAFLAGKPTPEVEAAREQRAIQNAVYDPR